MEVMLSLSVFATIAVGFTTALSALRKNSIAIEERIAVTQIVDNALRQALFYPTMDPDNPPQTKIYDRDVEVNTTIEEMELLTEDGQELTQMFRVIVNARYTVDGVTKEETAEAWRYTPLYRRP